MVEKEKADMHTLYRVVSAFFCALDCIKVCPGIWRESDVWYQGRSCQRIETEYEVR